MKHLLPLCTPGRSCRAPPGSPWRLWWQGTGRRPVSCWWPRPAACTGCNKLHRALLPLEHERRHWSYPGTVWGRNISSVPCQKTQQATQIPVTDCRMLQLLHFTLCSSVSHALPRRAASSAFSRAEAKKQSNTLLTETAEQESSSLSTDWSPAGWLCPASGSPGRQQTQNCPVAPRGKGRTHQASQSSISE